MEGRHAEALPYAPGAVELQPWSDSANRLEIEVYARRGDQSNALLVAIRRLYPFAGAAISPESTR